MPLADVDIRSRYRHPEIDTDMWMSVSGTVGIGYRLGPERYPISLLNIYQYLIPVSEWSNPTQ